VANKLQNLLTNLELVEQVVQQEEDQLLLLLKNLPVILPKKWPNFNNSRLKWTIAQNANIAIVNSTIMQHNVIFQFVKINTDKSA